MTLIPTGGLVGIIAKIESESPAAARNLVQLALFESLSDQVEELRPTLEPMVLDAIDDITKSAQAALRRTDISKSDREVVGVSRALELISKELRGAEKAEFERKRRRDAKGRFMRTSFGGMDPNVARQSSKNERTTRINEARREVKRLKGSGLIDDDTPLQFTTQRRDANGAIGTERTDPLLTTPKEFEAALEFLPDDAELTALQVRRADFKNMNPKQQAALDMVGLFSRQDEVGSKHILNRMPLDDHGNVADATRTASNWNAPSAGGSAQDRQAYRRLKITGQALQAVGAPGSTTSIAGGLAELISDLGPEAEKVLGPGIRRAAYRYRGTERRPDPVVRQQVSMALRTTFGLEGGDDGGRANDVPGIAVGRHARSQGTSDQKRMKAAGDAAASYFLGLAGNDKAIADPELAHLSMESGEIPPSQGVIIDSDGDIVSQAVGYNGDHYLPFDLRNLGALKGGQYVRTRAIGGPTTEDIYTGLMTGARQLQVVSNSGVFTLEFDPTLRGGRRYSDKAHRMVQRYQQMLETIAKPDSNLYERDLSQAQMAEVRRRVAGAQPETQEEYRRMLRTETERARLQASMADYSEENAEVLEAARNQAETRIRNEIGLDVFRNFSPQQRTRLLEDMTREEADRIGAPGVRKLRLDGAGYDRAMKALKQEFPYYIRDAGWQSLPDWIKSRGMTNPGYKNVGANDRGYVEPGQTNPEIGLQGANARRKVGSVRTTREDAAPQQQTGQQPAAQQEQGASAQPAAQSAPATQPKPASAKLLDTGSPIKRELDTNAAALLNVVSGFEPYGGYMQESMHSTPLLASNVQYFHYVGTEIKNKTPRGREGSAFVDWFLKAKPEEQNKAIAGMEDLEKELLRYQELESEAPDVARATKGFKDMISLLDPYEKFEGREPDYRVEPNPANPRPYRLRADIIPDVGSENETFEVAKNRLIMDKADGGHRMETAIADLEPMSAEERVDFITELTQQHNKAIASSASNVGELESELRAAHLAWSLLHTKDVSTRLRNIMGADAGPKVEKAAARPRRVIVHKLDDPFSRRMRAELGIPEPSSV